jgi:hypothetical protein
MKKLARIDQELADEEKKLEDLPISISHMKERMPAIAQQIHTLHAQEQPIHYKKSFDL